MCVSEIRRYQSIRVVAHVPQGDKGQSDPAAVLSRDLVLAGHHRGHCPPGTQNQRVLLVTCSPVASHAVAKKRLGPVDRPPRKHADTESEGTTSWWTLIKGTLRPSGLA